MRFHQLSGRRPHHRWSKLRCIFFTLGGFALWGLALGKVGFTCFVLRMFALGKVGFVWLALDRVSLGGFALSWVSISISIMGFALDRVRPTLGGRALACGPDYLQPGAFFGRLDLNLNRTAIGYGQERHPRQLIATVDENRHERKISFNFSQRELFIQFICDETVRRGTPREKKREKKRAKNNRPHLYQISIVPT